MNSCSNFRSNASILSEQAQSLLDISSILWDVLVIGAGPAGSLSARCSALSGLKTLLVDAKQFPRYKVCGGCLNSRALRVLDQAALGELSLNSNAVPLSDLRVHAGRQTATFSINGGLSISRHALDERMLAAARAAGASVLDETTAQIEAEYDHDFRRVLIRRREDSAVLKTRIVVCADGLSRSSARHLPELSTVTSPRSRIGIGTLLEGDQLPERALAAYPSGTIVMAVASGGYIGITRAEQNRLSVAAAFDATAIKASGSPEAAVTDGLKRVGLPWLDDCAQIAWHGTPGLTSHAKSVATYRTFVVGDAAGYVEPFTGEGMAAALESAWNVAPIVVEGVRQWDDALIQRWQSIYQQKIRRRQLVCRTLSTLLRFPNLVSASLPCFRTFPFAGKFLVSTINAE